MDDGVQLERVEPADKLAYGIWTRMGGRREYLIPAINFRALREMQTEMQSLGAMQTGKLPTPEQVQTVAKLAHAAIRRNYPDMTLEQVEDMIDMSNFLGVFNAIVNVSGLEKKGPPGEPGATSP